MAGRTDHRSPARQQAVYVGCNATKFSKMIKGSASTISILVFFVFCSCGQTNNTKPRSKFFEFLNNYQADSLQTILASDFEINRTFINNKTERNRFFEYYLPVSRNFNTKLKVLKSEISEKTEIYQVEDHSDYLELLKIDYPEWIITLNKNSRGQIKSAVFDTTKSFQKYLLQSKEKGEAFGNWLHIKYPEDKNDDIYTVPGLMQKRLQEYIKGN